MIVAARADGPFEDLFDLARRVELKMVGKRPLENLARAGAFDALEKNRARIMANIDRLVDYSATCHAEANSAQGGLFGGPGEALPPPKMENKVDWLPAERLGEEHGAVGFYLSGHPLDDYLPALRRKGVKRAVDLMGGGAGRVAGTVATRRDRKSARGNRFAFVEFSDPDGIWEAAVWAEQLAQYDDLLRPGNNLVCHIEVKGGDDGSRLVLNSAQTVAQVAEDAGNAGLEVHVAEAGCAALDPCPA